PPAAPAADPALGAVRAAPRRRRRAAPAGTPRTPPADARSPRRASPPAAASRRDGPVARPPSCRLAYASSLACAAARRSTVVCHCYGCPWPGAPPSSARGPAGSLPAPAARHFRLPTRRCARLTSCVYATPAAQVQLTYYAHFPHAQLVDL